METRLQIFVYCSVVCNIAHFEVFLCHYIKNKPLISEEWLPTSSCMYCNSFLYPFTSRVINSQFTLHYFSTIFEYCLVKQLSPDWSFFGSNRKFWEGKKGEFKHFLVVHIFLPIHLFLFTKLVCRRRVTHIFKN